MPDPVSNAEIEDVLSSIRRLVSEEPSNLKRRAPAAAPGRLVLTPAQRVEPVEAEDAPEDGEAAAQAHPAEEFAEDEPLVLEDVAAEAWPDEAAEESLAEEPAPVHEEASGEAELGFEAAAEAEALAGQAGEEPAGEELLAEAPETSTEAAEDDAGDAPWTPDEDDTPDLSGLAAFAAEEEIANEIADETAAEAEPEQQPEPAETAPDTPRVAPPSTLEERIKGLEAALMQAGGEWEPDGSESGDSDLTRPLRGGGDDLAATWRKEQEAQRPGRVLAFTDPDAEAEKLSRTAGRGGAANSPAPAGQSFSKEDAGTEDAPEISAIRAAFASIGPTLVRPEARAVLRAESAFARGKKPGAEDTEETPVAAEPEAPAFSPEDVQDSDAGMPAQLNRPAPVTDFALPDREPAGEAGFVALEPEEDPAPETAEAPAPDAAFVALEGVDEDVPEADFATPEPEAAQEEPELRDAPEGEAAFDQPEVDDLSPEAQLAPEVEAPAESDEMPEAVTDEAGDETAEALPTPEAQDAPDETPAGAETGDVLPTPEAAAAPEAETTEAPAEEALEWEEWNPEEEPEDAGAEPEQAYDDPAPGYEAPEYDTPEYADPEDTEAGDFNLYGDEAVLDEEALREMVAELVREELQGVLGERITRNVRRLVRREIERALALRDMS
jgi:hypothetical protein